MGCGQSAEKDPKASGAIVAAKQESGTVSRVASISPVARCKSGKDQFMSNQDRSALLNSGSISTSTRLLLSAPFSNFSSFNPHLYLTGVGGITLDNLKQYYIKCLINVAEEIPSKLFDSSTTSLEYYKFPICDSYTFPISEYLNKSADQINTVLKEKDGNVVVFCVAGMSRSSTVVLAYAMKYLKMSLKAAFLQMQEVRTGARPNLAFFEQLVQFERECLSTNSVQIVKESMDFEEEIKKPDDSEKAKKKNKKKEHAGTGQFISVPDFYHTECPHLLKLEIGEAKRSGNCPLVGQSHERASVSKVVAKKSANKLAGPEEKLSCRNHELKPFVVETISYEVFLKEFQKARASKLGKA